MTGSDEGASGAGAGGRLRAVLAPRRMAGLAIALGVALICVLGFANVQVLKSLESGLNDRLRVLFSPLTERQDPRISVITITEETLALFPYRSPVDRAHLAEVIDLLGSAGVKGFALDILIDQPTEPEKDARLIEAIRAFPGKVVLAYADERAGMLPRQMDYMNWFRAQADAVPGSAVLDYDPDGVVRRFDNYMTGEILGMSAAMLAAAGVEGDFQKRGIVDWRRETADHAEAFQKIQSQVLLNPALPRQMFSGWFGDRFVFIGADLPQTDRHATSLLVDPGLTEFKGYAGVLVHAHVLSQLLDGRVVANWSVDRRSGMAVTVAMALLGAAIGISSIGLHWRGLAVLGAGVGYLGLALVLAGVWSGPYLPLGPGLAALALSFGLGGAAEAFFSVQEKAFIRQAFSHYLEPAMVDRLARDRSSLRLGGERREISFIFTDVAGFTDMSEKLEPEELAALLNAYFDGMSDIIAAHDGSIDKFIGDAVVALFGALTTEADHALNAVLCAVAMDAFAEDFRRSHAHLGMGVTRIGVHSGAASVGNFGGRKRFDYTAMGDAMNTAARLESINKALGTRVTVSEAARRAAAGFADAARPLPPLRPVGRVMLKGKAEPVQVWNHDPVASQALREGYAAALALIGQDPAAALVAFEALAAEDGPGQGDPLVALHLTRLHAGRTDDRIA
ncbi:adenylate/guanylate cyclase domain-containing protein [uncultured Albimonas sp.]|uniref:adenylate/guanylate cyclase domain-containing protein n=1 Tax=uncultured Albimonas sp. TaxID=1331701 RepID=UPI0030EBD79B